MKNPFKTTKSNRGYISSRLEKVSPKDMEKILLKTTGIKVKLEKPEK